MDVITVGEIDDEFDENDENLVGILKKSFILFLKQENVCKQFIFYFVLFIFIFKLLLDYFRHEAKNC